MINARAETVAEKPAFRDALATRRCLIVADGFYEWQRARRPGAKQPWHVTRADGAPFAFAGLWAIWHGRRRRRCCGACTIITTEANDRLRDIHDRMPVILRDQDDEEAWLDHATPRARRAGAAGPAARRADRPARGRARRQRRPPRRARLPRRRTRGRRAGAGPVLTLFA